MAEAQIEDPRGRTIPRRTPANDLWGIEFWFKQPKDMKQKDKDPKVKKPEVKETGDQEVAKIILGNFAAVHTGPSPPGQYGTVWDYYKVTLGDK